MFGEPPKQTVTSPLEKGDHPETDDSEFLDAKVFQMYPSMIGALHWMVTIGRFDIRHHHGCDDYVWLQGCTAHRAPRKGHLLDRLK